MQGKGGWFEIRCVFCPRHNLFQFTPFISCRTVSRTRGYTKWGKDFPCRSGRRSGKDQWEEGFTRCTWKCCCSWIVENLKKQFRSHWSCIHTWYANLYFEAAQERNVFWGVFQIPGGHGPHLRVTADKEAWVTHNERDKSDFYEVGESAYWEGGRLVQFGYIVRALTCNHILLWCTPTKDNSFMKWGVRSVLDVLIEKE